MATSSATRETAPTAPLPLIVGSKLRCPRCHSIAPTLSYYSFDRVEEHADELNVVFKCRTKVDKGDGHIEPCRYVFSPGLTNDELSAAIRDTQERQSRAA